MDVIVRGLDEKLHRKFKAEAALRGISLSKALEEAMRTWLRSESMVALDENEANNLAYESMKDQLNNQCRGKYAVFCGGKFLGATDTLEEAGALARSSSTSAGKALVAKIGEKRPAGGEWLWSSLELQTA
jgi:hypothetical protein